MIGNGWISAVLMILLGCTGGGLVGCGFVALISATDLVPRWLQWSNAHDKSGVLEWGIILGTLLATCADFFHWQIPIGGLMVAFIGLAMGTFVGMLAGALTEVISVLPVVSSRLDLHHHVGFVLSAVVLGKIVGSLCQLWWFPHIFAPAM